MKNLTNNEISALKELNSVKNVLNLPEVKENATVVMKTKDHANKIRKLLDPITFKNNKESKRPDKTVFCT